MAAKKNKKRTIQKPKKIGSLRPLMATKKA
jgi:hypothetical protein